MPTYDYLVTAINCPPVPALGAFQNPGASPPVPQVYSVVTAGASGPGSLTTPFNSNGVRSEIFGRYGGGAYAIAVGLDITVSGLTATITQGTALVDGPVVLNAGGTVALADNTYNYLYVTQAGTLSKGTSANPAAPPTLPAQSCFLGRVQMSGGAMVGNVDRSGVMLLRGGMPWRRTADNGAPADAPPANLAFFQQSITGLFRWDGGAYRLLTPYDLSGWQNGLPGSSPLAPSWPAVIYRLYAPRPFSLLAGLPLSIAQARVAATALSTFNIRKNGSIVGHFDFAIGQTVATFTFAATVAFAVADLLEVQYVAQDATLSDLGFCIVATL